MRDMVPESSKNNRVARKKRDLPLIEGLEITTLAAEGKAMGKYNDIVVFVPMTVPGDVVDVQIRNHRRRFMEGTVVRYVRKSPVREEAFCEHFGICGGCKAESALCRTAQIQAGTGIRPAFENRQNSPSGNIANPRLRTHTVLPQQARIHFRPETLGNIRRDRCRRGDRGRRCARLPHSRQIRQGAGRA